MDQGRTPPTRQLAGALLVEGAADREAAAARDGALAAARARIKVLEQSLGLSASPASAPNEARARGVTAIAQSAELASVRAERDSLQASLEAAERRALLAGRQQRSERDRRTALATTLKQKEEELSRRAIGREYASAASQIVEQAASRREADRAVEALSIGVALLGGELREVEGEAAERSESLETGLLEALSRAAEAERLLATEVLCQERVNIEDAENRAVSEASAWQREATLQVRMSAATEEAHAEARRAATLEAALAAEVEGRQRDGKAAAAEAAALRAQVTEAEAAARVERERLQVMEAARRAHLLQPSSPSHARGPRPSASRRAARRATTSEPFPPLSSDAPAPTLASDAPAPTLASDAPAPTLGMCACCLRRCRFAEVEGVAEQHAKAAIDASEALQKARSALATGRPTLTRTPGSPGPGHQ